MSDLGNQVLDAVATFVVLVAAVALAAGALITVAAIYGIPWLYHHVSISVG